MIVDLIDGEYVERTEPAGSSLFDLLREGLCTYDELLRSKIQFERSFGHPVSADEGNREAVAA